MITGSGSVAGTCGVSVPMWDVRLSAHEQDGWWGNPCTRGWIRLQYQTNGRHVEIVDVGKDAVLVTGAAGFGGSHLVRQLLAHGRRVTGLDIVPPLHAGLLRRELGHPEFRYVWKSLQDIGPCDVEGHPVVAHLAAQADTPMAFGSPRYAVMQNIEGTVALLEAVRNAGGVRKMLYAGSGNEIGRPLTLPIDESHPLTPHNPYGFSKAAAELAVWAWYRAYGVPAVVLSTGVVIGPRMRREVFVFKWLWNAMHGLPIMVEGGQQTRDLSFIDDVIDTWVRAIQAPEDVVVGEKFFVGNGEERTVAELAEWCLEASGVDVPIEYVGYRPGEEGQREAFSTEKARRMLSHAPQVSAKEAVRLTANWVRTLALAAPEEAEPV